MTAVRRSIALELPPSAAEVLARLRDAGHECYAVGGAVRDALLGRRAQDVDITTSATPGQILALFEHTHPVGARFGVVLVVEKGMAVEVATFREDLGYSDGRHPDEVRFSTAAGDTLRRDFTVNALLYDPGRREIVDHVGGLEDLRTATLRAIGDPRARFAEDQLRLLRCVRFAAQLGFQIESETWVALTELSPRIDHISGERIREELDRLLRGPRPAQGLRMLLYSGLLSRLLPEVEAMVGVPQPPQFHPEGDVFVHTAMTLEHIERRSSPLAWGALLHDVGKPPTFRRAERIRFDGHVAEGMALARRILVRLRHDRSTIERVVDLVHYHLKFADVHDMRPATLKRFLRMDHFDDHLALHRADCMASHGDLSLHEFCMRKREELGEEALRPPPLLRGGDLLAMGYAPGPLVGEILRALEEAQLDGALERPEQARRWVRGRWPAPGREG